MNDADLDRWLRALPQRVEVPSSFQRDVWTRIAQSTPRSSWWQGAWLAFVRPTALVGAAAAVILVGAWFGRTALPEPDGAVGYVQAVSPFVGLVEPEGAR